MPAIAGAVHATGSDHSRQPVMNALIKTGMLLLVLALGCSDKAASGGAGPMAKEGVIVKGENGTKWCCPDGKKSDKCVKGDSSTPAGKRCNFADFSAPAGGATTPN